MLNPILNVYPRMLPMKYETWNIWNKIIKFWDFFFRCSTDNDNVIPSSIHSVWCNLNKWIVSV